MSLRTRIRILSRDGHRCVYCGATSRDSRLEVDHVVPRSRGGTSQDDNLVTSCWACNNGKGADEIAVPAWQ